MTSGIPTYTTDPFLNGLADAPQRVWTADDLFATIAGQPPEFAPGAGWDYSNTNYLMLALIAEHVGGASLGDLITERVFAPVGLRRRRGDLTATPDAAGPRAASARLIPPIPLAPLARGPVVAAMLALAALLAATSRLTATTATSSTSACSIPRGGTSTSRR